MAQNWRVAKSLIVLRDELRSRWPGVTFWTIGDEAHQDSWSDHNPNECCDVVCAADIPPDDGPDLDWLANTIVATDPPALKYVIWRDRIWTPQTGWTDYGGSYHSHVHVSVGWGADGRSTGPYDDTTSWGVANTGGGSLPTTGPDMSIIDLELGDSGSETPALFQPIRGLQYCVKFAGFDPGEIDGEYGPKTAGAVLACRKAMGSTVGAGGGDKITGAAYQQIMRAVAIAQVRESGIGGPSEEQLRELVADAVNDWLTANPPEPGKTPTEITLELTGKVTGVK